MLVTARKMAQNAPMPVVARISALWSKQKLFVAVFLLAFSAWFYLDGAIRYPRSNVRWHAHEKFREEGRLAEWPAYAAQQGWIKEPPERLYLTRDIAVQFVFGGLGTIAGLLLFVYWITQRKCQLRLEDGAVFTPSGVRVPFTSLRGVGKKRWDSKGIAVVRYEDKGRLLQFVVDDYKYETEPTRQILDVIEQQLLTRNDHAA